MTKDRVLYYDALNVVACFGVVAMHFNGLTHAYSATFDWRQAFFVDCIFYWAVPAFFMLSGATLLDYSRKYDTKTFFIKRLRRVVVPFLAWSVIALVWKVSTGQMAGPVGPRSLINLIFNTQIIDIYWFFMPLFATYLCMPVLTELKDNREALWYLVALAVLVNVFLPFVFSSVGVTWNSQANIPLAGGYLVYVLLGYLLRDCRLERRVAYLVYAAGVLGFLMRLIHTIVASDTAGRLVESTWGYTNLPCFLEAIAVFVLFSRINWARIFSSDGAARGLSSLAGCSFGIYLIHMIIFWYGLEWTGLNGGDIEWRLCGPVIAYLVCFLLVWVAKKIPVVRELFP